MTEPCATCKWRGQLYGYEGPGGTQILVYRCNQEDNGVPVGRCFVMDDFSCPRWERKEDKADKIAKAVADHVAKWTRGDLPDSYYKNGLLLSPQLLAEVIRPLLEEAP